jgi:hypothetical protein
MTGPPPYCRCRRGRCPGCVAAALRLSSLACPERQPSRRKRFRQFEEVAPRIAEEREPDRERGHSSGLADDPNAAGPLWGYCLIDAFDLEADVVPARNAVRVDQLFEPRARYTTRTCNEFDAQAVIHCGGKQTPRSSSPRASFASRGNPVPPGTRRPPHRSRVLECRRGHLANLRIDWWRRMADAAWVFASTGHAPSAWPPTSRQLEKALFRSR